MAHYIIAMVTTIQVSDGLLKKLKGIKMPNETYEELLWNLLEDTMELSEEAKKDIEKSRADYKAGRTISHEELKKELGL